MIPEEEKQEIIDLAVEKALLLIPSVVGNMMAAQAALLENNKKFYGKYPEFKNHKDAVMSVVEQIEGNNPLLDHKDILNKAVPKIRERINTLGKLNLDTVSANPPRKFERIESPSDNPHGKI